MKNEKFWFSVELFSVENYENFLPDFVVICSENTQNLVEKSLVEKSLVEKSWWKYFCEFLPHIKLNFSEKEEF